MMVTTSQSTEWRNASVGMVKFERSVLLVAADGNRRQYVRLDIDNSREEGVEPYSIGIPTVPPYRQIFGFSAANSSFRKIHLPFKRSRQIEMLLPQEIADNSLRKKQHPRFAYMVTPDDDGADVVYAVTEEDALQSSIDDLSNYHLSCGPVVLAELASWPLLRQQCLINNEITLIIDASMLPYALLKVQSDQLLDFRVVSHSACDSSDGAIIANELRWLAKSMVLTSPAEDYVVLGELPIECYSQLPQCRHILLNEFEIDDWRWLRALGLTTINDQCWLQRMMNFRWGDFAFQSPWRQWLRPWLSAFILMILVVLLGGGLFITDYWQLLQRQQQLNRELRETFEAALPNTPMVDPVRQLQQVLPRNNQIDEKGLIKWLSILQPLLKPQTQQQTPIMFQRLHYDSAGIVIYGSASDYKQLDELQAGLKQGSGVNTVTLEDASKLNNAELIQFRIKVQ